MRRLFLCAAAVWFVAAAALAASPARPGIARVYPLGGRRGDTVKLEILGESLSNATTVEFDCSDLRWRAAADGSSYGRLTGEVVIAADASLGPHLLRVTTLEGNTNSAMVNVGQFPSLLEAEPNDVIARAQNVPALPVEIQGRLDGSADIDVYSFHVKAGERWVFDLRSIEYGSAVKAKMSLTDAGGAPIAFNDDRAGFEESPLIEHTFPEAGQYFIKLDQYRGPRGFNFGKNCAYVLRISALPNVSAVTPLGGRTGHMTRVTIEGTGLEGVRGVKLTLARRAEHYRLTQPYTMPVRFAPDPAKAADVPTISASTGAAGSNRLSADIRIPSDAPPGLWRIWLTTASGGMAEAGAFEVLDWPEISENDPAPAQLPYVIDGVIGKPGEVDRFVIPASGGTPLRISTLAVQLGGQWLDSVLELRDAAGKAKLAENDDVVAGQGSLIGNPDSRLFYTPAVDGPLTLLVRDRIRRGGPAYAYRIKVESALPGFQLVTTPENFAVPRGGSAEIKVHLIREPGHEGAVEVWLEGLPPRVASPRAVTFRADQRFEPNADGADMIIPELTFTVRVPESLAAGTYPVRVMGRASNSAVTVSAQSMMMMGPLLDAWNFIRRPMPGVTMTVFDPPPPAEISLSTTGLKLESGKSSTLTANLRGIPDPSRLVVKGLPPGVTQRVSVDQGKQAIVTLEASPTVTSGSFEVSVEAPAGGRWVSSEPQVLAIQTAR
jgi:hypothetical protein